MIAPRVFSVLLAGGASSRLWPASGTERPKWDLRLGGPSLSAHQGQPQEPLSLLQGAFARARSVSAANDCFVVTAAAQAALVARTLPELPAGNILVEPEPRDTAGAVAYGAAAIARRCRLENVPASQAVMLVLPGDHVIRDVPRFGQCAATAAQAALEHPVLVTFGIVPRAPHTGYGYVQRGTALPLQAPPPGAPAVARVLAFKEKPDRATAEHYVASGQYFWNGGIFAWAMSTLLDELDRQLPGHRAMLAALSLTATPQDWESTARSHFPTLKKTSIDFGIMEGARSVATVAADFDWDDIGSWSAVAAHLPAQDGNAVTPGTALLAKGSGTNVVFAPGKRVALVGVEGLAVVVQGDEVLVCRLDRDQEVKDVSAWAKSLS